VDGVDLDSGFVASAGAEEEPILTDANDAGGPSANSSPAMALGCEYDAYDKVVVPGADAS